MTQTPDIPGTIEPPAAALERVTFGYHSATPVVQGVSAKLRPGRVTALIGPNASGKSTLLRLLLGIETPWQGTVRIGGLEVGKLGAKDRARWVSYVPQNPGSRFAFTVRQIIAMGRFGQNRIMAEPAIDAAVEQAGLGELQHRVFAELSGGQQQRVILARAELQAGRGGRVMLLDEPGSHLDLAHAHTTMARLRDLAATGLAVLVVVHDLNLAAGYADDAWLLDQGQLVAAGPWDRVLRPEVLSPVYGIQIDAVQQGEGGRVAFMARSPVILPL